LVCDALGRLARALVRGLRLALPDATQTRTSAAPAASQRPILAINAAQVAGARCRQDGELEGAGGQARRDARPRAPWLLRPTRAHNSTRSMRPFR